MNIIKALVAAVQQCPSKHFHIISWFSYAFLPISRRLGPAPADAVFFFCKIVVVGLNVIAAWFLIRATAFGDNVRILAVDLVLIGFITYIIASVVLHLYDAVQVSQSRVEYYQDEK